MQTKHTPGPWQTKRSDSKSAVNIVGSHLGSKYKIARCPITGWGDNPETQRRENEEVEANARLIAAAPELLEALVKSVSVIEQWHGKEVFEIYYKHAPEMKVIRSVIEKVTGEKEVPRV